MATVRSLGAPLAVGGILIGAGVITSLVGLVMGGRRMTALPSGKAYEVPVPSGG